LAQRSTWAAAGLLAIIIITTFTFLIFLPPFNRARERKEKIHFT
jgi:hypothetical protein